MNINKVFLMGRLTSDPELKMSASNVPVLRFTIAVNRNRTSKNDQTPAADFIDCVCFNKQAEFVSKYFKQGSLIIAFGSLQIDTWKDKNGNNQRSARVVVNEVKFGESRKEGASAHPVSEKESEAFSNASDNSEFFSDMNDISGSEEDLPF